MIRLAARLLVRIVLLFFSFWEELIFVKNNFNRPNGNLHFYNFGIPTEHSCFVIMIEPMIEPDYLHAQTGRW